MSVSSLITPCQWVRTQLHLDDELTALLIGAKDVIDAAGRRSLRLSLVKPRISFCIKEMLWMGVGELMRACNALRRKRVSASLPNVTLDRTGAPDVIRKNRNKPFVVVVQVHAVNIRKQTCLTYLTTPTYPN